MINENVMINQSELASFIPETSAPVKLRGIESNVEIYRDEYGIPHIKAQTINDAFFGQGFTTAQDRLWHMTYDKFRASGRLAELLGSTAVEQDSEMRRFRLEASAKADYHILSEESRLMFDSYAKGVNSFLESTQTFPIEYKLLNIQPESWNPWDGLMILKVRHIFMGTFEAKSWRARLINRLGVKTTSSLLPGYQPGHLLILPPGAKYEGPVIDALSELEYGALLIDWLKDTDMGSNNWVIDGTKTLSGKPLLAGDPHRALETPNVYYQNHVACKEFDVIGVSFPGVPGFPHFGHNSKVAWAVTHAGADYQDLYLEEFNKTDPNKYKFENTWETAEVYQELIKVKGASDVKIEIIVTRHGPIIGGNPSNGYGIALKYNQTAEPNKSGEVLLKMLSSTNTKELDQSMNHWVDPANNFVFADVEGNTGYLLRGKIPIRTIANAWLPVPGWTGEHEWQKYVEFDEMPRLHNPKNGYIVTANNKIISDDYPHYLALDNAPEFRARRITSRINALGKVTVEDMTQIQADQISIPALFYLKHLANVSPLDDPSREAHALLMSWDGNMQKGSVAATIYSAFRIHLDGMIIRPLLGSLANEALGGTGRGGAGHAGRLRAHLLKLISEDDLSVLPKGETWLSTMSKALAESLISLKKLMGEDMNTWNWGTLHKTAPQHPLSSFFPDYVSHLNPRSVSMGGDGDTPQAAAYPMSQPYSVTNLSVLRYVFDLSNWNESKWVVPLGSSGHPASPHYTDQLPIWADNKLIPMIYDWNQISKEAKSHQQLIPDAV